MELAHQRIFARQEQNMMDQQDWEVLKAPSKIPLLTSFILP